MEALGNMILSIYFNWSSRKDAENLSGKGKAAYSEIVIFTSLECKKKINFRNEL
jgi:hypothetical protein